MNPLISLGPQVLLTASGAAWPQLWTPAIRLAAALEIVWWTGALAFLAWLTRPSARDESEPNRPKHEPREEDADRAPPIAA